MDPRRIEIVLDFEKKLCLKFSYDNKLKVTTVPYVAIRNFK